MLKYFIKSSFKQLVVQQKFSTMTFNPSINCLDHPCIAQYECKQLKCCKFAQQESQDNTTEATTINNTSININLNDNHSNNDININLDFRPKHKSTSESNLESYILIPETEVSIIDGLGETVSTISDTVSDVASSVGETVSDVADAIGDVID